MAMRPVLQLACSKADCGCWMGISKGFKKRPKTRKPTDAEVKSALVHLFGEYGEWLFEVLKDDGERGLGS